MNTKFVVLPLVLALTFVAVASGSAAPDSGPCAPGGTYDPACDANQDGQITVTDIQLTAGHWNQTGTYSSDNNHNHLGQVWMGNGNPLVIQGAFSGSSPAPLILSNSQGEGLRASSANHDGIVVSTAGVAGLRVGSAIYGVTVQSASGYGLHVVSAGGSAINVDMTGGSGLYVNTADNNGVNIESANSGAGVYVNSAGTNGFQVNSAVNNGLYVGSAINGVYVNSASNYAGNFNGNIYVGGNCVGCLIARLAVNSGEDTLQPGDVVAIDGVEDSPFDNLEMLMRVRRATLGSALVGVVSGRAEPVASIEVDTRTLVPRDGEPTQPGDYVSVVIYGPMQVRANGNVAIGQRVAVDDSGAGRALRRVTVQGVTLDEGGSSLGVALDAAKDGMVWVLVNPQ